MAPLTSAPNKLQNGDASNAEKKAVSGSVYVVFCYGDGNEMTQLKIRFC